VKSEARSHAEPDPHYARKLLALSELFFDTTAKSEYSGGVALIIPRGVYKELAAVPRADARRLLDRLEAIAAAPDAAHLGVTALVGEPGAFRARQGTWRAVFRIDDGDVIVERVGHRREGYR
jgi:mRNA-degrading endonuclease RelE of RelBE toxin-antitoxin system